MRKLASIEEVLDVQSIPGADAIEVATVRGWQVVIKKGEMVKGSKCVYMEIDSFLPAHPVFSFLGKTLLCKGQEGYRLRTIKLRGQISQGLALPVEMVAEGFCNPSIAEMPVGSDVTEILGIMLYEIPLPENLLKEVKGFFPGFIPRTDEERVQNMSEEQLGQIVDANLYATEKLDGSSITVYARKGEVGVCSRNIEYKTDADNMYTQMLTKYDLYNKLLKYSQEHGVSIAIQGELIGVGVQGNRYKRIARDVFWFTGYNITEGRRLSYNEFDLLCMTLGIMMVPLTAVKVEGKDRLCISKWLEASEGHSKLLSGVNREGIVVRDRENTERSFKVINNKYLLKYSE